MGHSPKQEGGETEAPRRGSAGQGEIPSVLSACLCYSSCFCPSVFDPLCISFCPLLSSFLCISLSLHVCLISLHILLFLCVCLSASLSLSLFPPLSSVSPLPCSPSSPSLPGWMGLPAARQVQLGLVPTSAGAVPDLWLRLLYLGLQLPLSSGFWTRDRD